MRSRNSFMKFGRKHDGGVARDFAVGGARAAQQEGHAAVRSGLSTLPLQVLLDHSVSRATAILPAAGAQTLETSKHQRNHACRLFTKRPKHCSERQWSGPAGHRLSTTPSRGILLFDRTFSSCTVTATDSWERWTPLAVKWSSAAAVHYSMPELVLPPNASCRWTGCRTPRNRTCLLDSPCFMSPPHGRRWSG